MNKILLFIFGYLATTPLSAQKPNWQNMEMLTAATVSDSDRAGFNIYREALADCQAEVNRIKGYLRGTSHWLVILDSMALKMGKDTPALADFQHYQAQSKLEEQIKARTIKDLTEMSGWQELQTVISNDIANYRKRLDSTLDIDIDPRAIVADDYNNDRERYYGNANVTGPNAKHGTHVAGIIGAQRGNQMGIDGVADQVRIMVIRAVPNGDERDKDVANAIRYAVDNGAKVINMSFGKKYNWDKKAVDDAVKYAGANDVLLVHAAGNDGNNIDDPRNTFFPSPYYLDGSGHAGTWINVGASGRQDDSTLVASFSNYGKRNVDVFAPGVQIYSCFPGSKYGFDSGTSMATPVVAGLAALIREYYPKLTAVQVKEIILTSVVKPTHTVIVKDGKERKKVYLNDICVSGGVVNAYQALKLAATY